MVKEIRFAKYHTIKYLKTMNKKIILLTLLLITTTANMAMAQEHTPRGGHIFSRDRHVINQIILKSSNNETFVAYIDGKPQNARPRKEVILQNLSSQPHALYIRLQNPVDRIGVITLSPDDFNHNFAITYDPINDYVIISDILDQHNHVGSPNSPVLPGGYSSHSGDPHHGIHPPHATPEEMSEIISMMSASSYDNERINLGKTFLKGHNVRTDQIMRMTQTINFDSRRLEFLIYAFEYCLDPENYYKTIELLSYKSSKDKLLKRINGQ